MAGSLNRRDFLRLAGLLPLSLFAPRWSTQPGAGAGRQNVLIIVLDAWSGMHLSLNDYPRETMPNLTKLARRAIVYHNHYAGSSVTPPGTASILTGTLPWTHRALGGAGRIADKAISHNIFEVFGDYYGLAYTHNGWAEILLNQLTGFMEEHIPSHKLYLAGYESLIRSLFGRDGDTFTVAWTRYMKQLDGYAYSLFLSGAYKYQLQKRVSRYAGEFPRGLPNNSADEYFLMEDAVTWFSTRLPQIPQPFLSYLHFLPPHAPYRTSEEFLGRFHYDGLHWPKKPIDVFASASAPPDQSRRRISYDEFMMYADKSFGGLYRSLQASGVLENTWLIVTGDHGEMFERGIIGHSGAALYQPVIRVPLLIFEPGRKQRLDIHDLTSAVDLLPTLAHLTGHTIPAWTEGTVLPPFATAGPQRSAFAVHAEHVNPAAALTRASTVLMKDVYKLHYYFGYPEVRASGLVKLFNVRQDPEEMEDLSSSEKGTTAALLDELKAKITEVNRPYA